MTQKSHIKLRCGVVIWLFTFYISCLWGEMLFLQLIAFVIVKVWMTRELFLT